MLKRIKFLLFSAALFFSASSIKGQIVVDNSVTLSEAISNLLGPGVEFSNVTFSGDANQIGIFNSSNANVGLNSGIMMATGDVNNAFGPNDESAATIGGGLFGATDADLDQLDGLSHNDAAILEFDFVAHGTVVSFNYVFASEEYPEYTGAGTCGDVSDVFGFFLSGPGITGAFSNNGENIALIPNTNQFVSIHNLNGSCDGTAVVGDADCNYCEYYVNNGDGFTAPYNNSETYVQYDGLTVVLTAFRDSLVCGETYHIKLAIADVSDTAFDSAVFFEEGSFSANGFVNVQITNPPIANWPENTLGEGCIYGTFEVFESDSLAADTLDIWYSGSAINGVDYELLPDVVIIPSGTSSVVIPIMPIEDGVTEGAENLIISFEYVNECGEVDTSFAEVTILEQIPLVVPNLPDVYVCPNGSSQVVVNPSGGFPNYHYDWSTGDTTATVIVDQLITYTVTVSDFCGQTAQVSFNGIPAPDPTANVVQDEVFVCLNVDANATATASGGVAPYSYQWTGSNSTNTSATFQFADLGEQTLTVTDACGHTDTDVVMVSPITIQPIVSISPDPIHVCPTSSATTQATASSGTPPYNYAWTGSSTTGTTGTFDAADIGYQFVTVTDNCGFVGNDSVLVILSEILPEVTITDDDIYICPNATETTSAVGSAGTAPYSYSWTGSTTQNATGTFNFDDAGWQYVTVTDACGYTAMDSLRITVPVPMEGLPVIEICIGEKTGGLVEGGTFPYSYEYDTLGFSFSPQTIFTALTPGYYPITITDDCGEVFNMNISVIICDTYIGNIFTPNGDGKNDTFEVQGGENFPGSKMQIFNRWGNVVYENENYYNQWIGADNPAATYYYIYTRNDGKVYNGYVMLVKDKE